MACSSKPGVKPFLDYIETATGQKITQADWHDIRELTAQEYGIEGKLPQNLVKKSDVITLLLHLDVDFCNQEDYEDNGEAYDDAWSAVQGKPVTQGTVMALGYLRDNGIEDTLAQVRLDRTAKKKGDKVEKPVSPQASGGLTNLVASLVVDSNGERFDSANYVPKFNADSGISTEGTHLQGYVGGNYSDLVKTFGEPKFLYDTKSTVEWTIEFESAEGSLVATIYDWKRKDEGDDDFDPSYVNEWNIGGKDPLVIDYINRSLRNSRSENATTQRNGAPAESAKTESGSSKSGAVSHGDGWDQDYWNAVTR